VTLHERRWLEFRALGPLALQRDGSLIAVTAPKQRALLALLLLRLNEPVSQDEMIDALWNGDAPVTARASFQNQIHALRRLLGHQAIERTPAGYVLRAEPEALDVQRFRRLAAEARNGRASERAAKLGEALALWRGHAFPELSGNPSAQAAITRLEEERLGALEEWVDAELELGNHAALVPELEELVARHPLRERLWAQLMLALYRSGRQADALGAYLRAYHALVDALGIEPGVVLRELQRAILVQDRALDDSKRSLGWTLERAAGILPRSPRERAESLYEYGSALIRVGELAQAVSTLEAAARLAQTAGDAGLLARVRVQRSYLAVFAEGASMVEELAVAKRAVHVLRDLGDHAGLAFASGYEAHLLRDTGHAEAALALALHGAELAARAGENDGEAACRRMAAYCACLGPTPVPEAMALCEAAEANRDERRPLSVRDGRAWMLAQSGRIVDARVLYRSELDVLRERGIMLNLTVGMELAALAERTAGDLRGAAAHLRTAHALVEAQAARGDQAAVAGELACVLALLGEHAEAARLGNEARALVAAGDPLGETLWRRALALVAAHSGSHEEARRLSSEACEHAERTDWLTFRGETLEEAAYVHQLAGDLAGWSEALHAALVAYEQKGNNAGATRVRATLAGSDPWLGPPSRRATGGRRAQRRRPSASRSRPCRRDTR
jgi:DNA-binding SARP family transcriptional activator